MLTGDLVRARVQRGKLRLAMIDPSNAEIAELASRLVAVFNLAKGASREETQSAAEAAAQGPVHPAVAKGLIHLLWKRCDTSSPEGPDAAALRGIVFREAARARGTGVSPFPRNEILAGIGITMGLDAAGVEAALYSDLPSEEIVREFEPVDSSRLLDDYNLGLVQGALLRSTRVIVTLGRPRPEMVRAILRASRFHRLLVSSRRPTPGRLELSFDGPANLVEETVKHGMQLACFIPWILCLPKFHLVAEILWGAKRTPCHLELTHTSGPAFRAPGPIPGPSREAMALVSLFAKEAPGWRIEPDSEPVELDDVYWIPDPRLTRESDESSVWLDLITRGRPQSVTAHLRRLARQKKTAWPVAASQALLAEPVPEATGRLIPFKSIPLVDHVIQKAEALLGSSGGPRLPST